MISGVVDYLASASCGVSGKVSLSSIYALYPLPRQIELVVLANNFRCGLVWRPSIHAIARIANEIIVH